MSTPAAEYLPISDVSERTGLSISTIRFYEQAGLLLEPVHRTDAGHRAFSPRDVRWLTVCDTLRRTGMPVQDLRRYVEAARHGPGTVQERHALLTAHEERVRAKMNDLQRSLEVITTKVRIYGREIREGSADLSWSKRTCEDEIQAAEQQQ